MRNGNKILVVDDDDLFRKAAVNTFKAFKKLNLKVFDAKTGAEAIRIVDENPDVGCVLLDYNFDKWAGGGQLNGLEIAERIREIAPQIPIIMTSGVGDRGDIAMQAARNFVLDFLDKPFSRSQVYAKIEKFYEIDERDNRKEGEQAAIDAVNGAGFIAKSPAMKKVCYDAALAAANDWNLLIVGETGVGKTLLAEIIHKISPRKNSIFKELNCGAIPRELFESELFGHAKGSFTGAVGDKQGVFDIVGEGAFLLDEIVEIPLDVQSKLLYALGEQKAYYRVGAPNDKKTNRARVIASTSWEPSESVEERRIRDDLLGRFTQIIRIPPLRDRKEDIPALVEIFLASSAKKLRAGKIRIEKDAVDLLVAQPWVKNVRQLSNHIEKVVAKVAFERKKRIVFYDVRDELTAEYGLACPEPPVDNATTEEEVVEPLASYLLENREKYFTKDIRKRRSGGIKALLNATERRLIEKALIAAENNISAAAAYLNENKDTFRYKMSKLGVGNGKNEK